MKLLVCICRTPDTTSRIEFTDNDTVFNSNGITYIMNPYDEWYALVRALELKETHGGTVTVLNVGTAPNDQIIRKALAIGADDAVRIDFDPESAYDTAKAIADFAKDENYDVLFFGKETIDYNGGEVPGMVSEFLDIPFVSYANHLDMEENTATISHDVEGGVEIVNVQTPFALSAAKGLAERRIASMKGIMLSKRKPIKIIPATKEDQSSKIISFALPAQKSGVKLVEPDHMDELVKLLHEEAKVI